MLHLVFALIKVVGQTPLFTVGSLSHSASHRHGTELPTLSFLKHHSLLASRIPPSGSLVLPFSGQISTDWRAQTLSPGPLLYVYSPPGDLFQCTGFKYHFNADTSHPALTTEPHMHLLRSSTWMCDRPPNLTLPMQDP